MARTGKAGKGLGVTARNLYRERWALPLSGAKLTRTASELRVAPEMVEVLQRFNGGMVYEVGGRKHVLAEIVIEGHPTLFVFALSPSKGTPFMQPKLFGLPDAVMEQCRSVGTMIVKGIKLPEKFHNIELDVTVHAATALALPAGWELVKALLKIPSRVGTGLMCDCDVDGPCGYCCDTCVACENCYLCC